MQCDKGPETLAPEVRIRDIQEHEWNRSNETKENTRGLPGRSHGRRFGCWGPLKPHKCQWAVKPDDKTVRLLIKKSKTDQKAQGTWRKNVGVLRHATTCSRDCACNLAFLARCRRKATQHPSLPGCRRYITWWQSSTWWRRGLIIWMRGPRAIQREGRAQWHMQEKECQFSQPNSWANGSRRPSSGTWRRRWLKYGSPWHRAGSGLPQAQVAQAETGSIPETIYRSSTASSGEREAHREWSGQGKGIRCPTPEQSGRSIWWGRQRRASHWTAGPWFVDGTSRSEMSRRNSLSIPPKLQLRAKSGSSFTRGATESKEPGNGGQIWIYESSIEGQERLEVWERFRHSLKHSCR